MKLCRYPCVCFVVLCLVLSDRAAVASASPATPDTTQVGDESLVARFLRVGKEQFKNTVLPALSRDETDSSNDYYLTTFVGDFAYRWPYRSTSIYRPLPAWHYNRVDGLALGVRKGPLEWDAYERIGAFGQIGYAFSVKRVQYELSAEARLGEPYGEEDFDVKVGASYRRLTTPDDVWKSGWAENTLGAFFFNYDLFDYYETEGVSLYSAARLGPYFQLSAAFRSEDYRTMNQDTEWSLFGGDHFRFNPPIDEGHMQSIIVVAEGGSVSRFHSHPSGAVFRVEAELGKGLGGDFSFHRFVADGRSYVRTSRRSGLAMRLRGGRATGSVPLQKAFTLGGIGSVRGYPQNVFLGNRMMLANVEYAIADLRPFGDLLDGFQLIGFFDAGWVSLPDRSFRFDDMFTSAGIGVGFLDRRLRLELALPLTDRGGSRELSLWLRLLPAF